MPCKHSQGIAYFHNIGIRTLWIFPLFNVTYFLKDTSFSGYTIKLARNIQLNNTSSCDNWYNFSPKNIGRHIVSKGKSFSGYFIGYERDITVVYINSEQSYIMTLAIVIMKVRSMQSLDTI